MFGEETDISCRLYMSSPKPQILSIHIVVTKKEQQKQQRNLAKHETKEHGVKDHCFY